MEFMKAGGSYAIVFGKKLQTIACETLGVPLKSAVCVVERDYHDGQGLTAVKKSSTPMPRASPLTSRCMRARMCASKSILWARKTPPA
jgi:aconitase B